MGEYAVSNLWGGLNVIYYYLLNYYYLLKKGKYLTHLKMAI
jgi:hypothetical protein